jgi:hypothetical protein
VRIAYPYHPRFGEPAVVLGSKQHAGTAHVVIRQTDGTLSLLPKWMTDPAVTGLSYIRSFLSKGWPTYVG